MATGDTLCVFTPYQNEPPATNYALADLRNGHPILAFDDTTSWAAIFTSILPRNYGGGGLTVYNSTRMRIENPTFTNWYTGAQFDLATEISVIRPTGSGMRVDGLFFDEVSSIVIEDAHFHDWLKSPTASDHSDMIQFTTSGNATPTRKVAIRRCVLDVGDGSYGDLMQGIFMRNEKVDGGTSGPEMFYEDIDIDDNVIRGQNIHGITVGEVNRLRIRNNTLLRKSATTDLQLTPSINLRVGSTNVLVCDNTAPRIGRFGLTGESVPITLPDPMPDGWIVDGNRLTS